MEPLSGAASVISVASLAIQVCEELKKSPWLLAVCERSPGWYCTHIYRDQSFHYMAYHNRKQLSAAEFQSWKSQQGRGIGYIKSVSDNGPGDEWRSQGSRKRVLQGSLVQTMGISQVRLPTGQEGKGHETNRADEDSAHHCTDLLCWVGKGLNHRY